jgi:hypothetical protein
MKPDGVSYWKSILNQVLDKPRTASEEKQLSELRKQWEKPGRVFVLKLGRRETGQGMEVAATYSVEPPLFEDQEAPKKKPRR